MSYSQKSIDPAVEYCKFCENPFIPNKYNHDRQIYCTSRKCRRERRKVRNLKFAKENPTYWKKSPSEKKENSYRTKIYNPQRQEKRRIESLAKRVIIKQKRVIVDSTQSFVSLLNFFFLTFIGMTSYSVGGLRQSSAFSTSNLLNSFYIDGVSIIRADKNLKQKMEVLYEYATKSDQCLSAEEFAEILQLGGSSSSSR